MEQLILTKHCKFGIGNKGDEQDIGSLFYRLVKRRVCIMETRYAFVWDFGGFIADNRFTNSRGSLFSLSLA